MNGHSKLNHKSADPLAALERWNQEEIRHTEELQNSSDQAHALADAAQTVEDKIAAIKALQQVIDKAERLKRRARAKRRYAQRLLTKLRAEADLRSKPL